MVVAERTGIIPHEGADFRPKRDLHEPLNGYTNDPQNQLEYATGTGVIEFAVTWNMLLNDPYNMGFQEATVGGNALMSLSQSFGYSVAGGQIYGDNRLGSVVVPSAQIPEPTTLALLGLGLAGLGFSRRQR